MVSDNFILKKSHSVKGDDINLSTTKKIRKQDVNIIVADDLTIYRIVGDEIRRQLDEGCDGCIDLNNIDVHKVTDMDYLFEMEDEIVLLDVSMWDTSHVTHMIGLFNSCANLRRVDLSNWNTSSVQKMNRMFGDCTKLEYIGDLSHWNLQNLQSAKKMFTNCKKLTDIGDMKKWTGQHKYDLTDTFLGSPLFNKK